MKNSRFALALAVLSIIFLEACGGGAGSSTPPPPQASTAPVSVTVRDAPPLGVTVLSFEVTVLSASLQSNTGKPDFPLVTTPTKIEIKQLEVQSAFLNTASVPADTYKSVTVTLMNPELTYKNETGAPLPSPLNCAVGAICEFKPPLSTAVVFSGAPFPLTISANSPTGLLVDVNLANAVTSTLGVDFTAAGAVTATQLTAQAGTGQLEEMEDVSGTVANKDTANNQFTLQSPIGNLTVKVDNNTVFEDFDKLGTPCSAIPQTFSCVANGQIVEVDLRLVAGGTLLAKKVEAADDANAEEFEGVIVGNISPAGFDMVMVEKISPTTAVDVGNLVHINAAGAQFKIGNAGNLPIAGLSFSTSTDLMVGQRVEIKKQTVTAGTPPSIDTNRVTLKKTSFTGKVKAKLNATDFTVDNLPPLFANATPSVTQIEVRASAANFENVTGVSALNIPPNADTVSVSGLLFKTLVDPVLVAKKVRKR